MTAQKPLTEKALFRKKVVRFRGFLSRNLRSSRALEAILNNCRFRWQHRPSQKNEPIPSKRTPASKLQSDRDISRKNICFYGRLGLLTVISKRSCAASRAGGPQEKVRKSTNRIVMKEKDYEEENVLSV